MVDLSQELAATGRPAVTAFAITPNDEADLTRVASYLRIGGAGNLKVTTENGDDVTIPSVLAGELIWLRVRRVWATGTTATGIVSFV